jgi:hypothetical protein
MKIRNVLASLITAMGCTKPSPTMFTTGGDEVPAERGRAAPRRTAFDDLEALAR